MIQVAVGIIRIANNVLLCQRKAAARYGLKWEFPGGKTEPDESPESCLCRELFEELAIQPYNAGLFYRDHFVYPDSGTFDVFYYMVPSYCGTIINNVFEAYSWVPLDRLREFDILEGNRNVINELLRRYATP
jgi:8-oxo-dGTP diphosphatase